MRPPCRSRSSWPLRVSLTDSMICRSGLSSSSRGGASRRFAGRAQQGDPGVGESGLRTSRAVVALVGDQGLRGPAAGQGGVDVEHVGQDVAFVGLGAGQGDRSAARAGCTPGAAAAPRSSASARRSSRSSAHPARSERLAVSRERPHSTGVESTIQTSSVDTAGRGPGRGSAQAILSASCA